MMEFAVRTEDGTQIVGVALTPQEIEALKTDGMVYIDLTKHKMGIWRKKGKQRVFLQPRQSRFMVLQAGTQAELGERLGVKIPQKINDANLSEG